MSVSDVEAPVNEEQVQLFLQPDLSNVVAVTTSEVDQIDSAKAQKMLDFDDSGIRVLNHSDIPVIMRSTRLKAPLSVALNDLYIVPGMNPRLDTEEWNQHIDWLAGQIQKDGFRDDCPLLVFATTEPGTNRPVYGIISGESRFHAVGRANKRGAQITAIPVTLAAEGMSIEEMTVQLATSNTGKPFSPLEQAVLAQRFSKWGRDLKEIAAILKVSSAYVSQLLKIAKAPNKVRAMLQEGSISFGAALSALNADPTTAVAALEQTAAAAKAAGKKTGTSKFMPEQQATKAARAYAPQMQNLLKKIKSNEGAFALMDDEVREAVESLLEEIQKMAERKPEEIAKAAAEKKAEKDANRAKRLAAKAEKEAKKQANAKSNTPANGQQQMSEGQKEPGGNAGADLQSSTQPKKPGVKPPTKSASKTTPKAGTKKPATKSANEKNNGASKATTRVRDQGEPHSDDVQTHPED